MPGLTPPLTPARIETYYRTNSRCPPTSWVNIWASGVFEVVGNTVLQCHLLSSSAVTKSQQDGQSSVSYSGGSQLQVSPWRPVGLTESPPENTGIVLKVRPQKLLCTTVSVYNSLINIWHYMVWAFWGFFVCDAVNISKYIASNCRMFYAQLIGYDLKFSCRDLTEVRSQNSSRWRKGDYEETRSV